MLRFLALDTSTTQMSVGLLANTQEGADQPWLHTAQGGAQASHALLPAIQTLLQQAGVSLSDVDALVLGRGPGAFTGLRTACAVVQGLAYGVRTPQHPNGLPVLVVDTLLAVAEEARHAVARSDERGPLWITAVLDARMGEVYAATYRFDDAAVPHAVGVAGPHLLAPEDLANVCPSLPPQAPHLWAGNVWGDAALRARMPPTVWAAQAPVTAWPTAAALLRVAPALWHAGAAVPAAQAQPLYVRDKVAQTTAERAAAAAEKMGS